MECNPVYLHPIIQEDLQLIASSMSEEQLRKLTNQRILITGVNGMIGSYLTFALLKVNETHHTNIHITGMVRNVEKATHRFCDVIGRSDFKLLKHDVNVPLNDSFEFDGIIHAASSTSPKQFTEAPVETILSNVVGTLNMLHLCKKNPSCSMLFLSTREAYGENVFSKEFVDEDDYGPINAMAIRSCYPLSKKMAENLCISFNSEYMTHCKIARIAHTYGPLMVIGDGRVVGDFLLDTVKQRDIVMNSEGKGTLALTYIKDVVLGLLNLCANDQLMVANISNDQEMITVRQLAEVLISINRNQEAQVVHQAASSEVKAGYLSSIPALLSSSRIKEHGWMPTLTLYEGLKRTVEYFEEMEDNYA